MSKKCSKCGKDNREEAKYCRNCGEMLSDAASGIISGLIGKKSVIAGLESFKSKAMVAGDFISMGVRVGLDCLIVGDSGTGKRWLADSLASVLRQAKVIKSDPVVVDASDLNAFFGKFEENLTKVKDTVLMVTNAQKVVPDGKSTNVGILDKLFVKMRKSPGNPTVFLLAQHGGFDSFIDNNPEVASLFEFRFRLESFSSDDMVRLCISELTGKWGIPVPSPEFRDKLKAHFNWHGRKASRGAINGWLAIAVAENLAVRMKYRGAASLLPEDIPDEEVFVQKGEEDIMAELDAFVGFDSVKAEIKSIINSIKAEKRDKGADATIKIGDHYVFSGNPGTGKTTVARAFANVLNALGILPSGQLVEMDAKKLIGQYIGDTEKNVNDAVEKAMGGILFIDEAYGLNDGMYGKNAIDALVPLVENRRGDFICILAGYRKEMDELLRVNPGLESRFNRKIDFPDYKAPELLAIFSSMLKSKGYSVSEEASGRLPKYFEKMYNGRTEHFGNGRAVRVVLEDALRRHNTRLSGVDEQTYKAESKVLSWTDIAGEDASRPMTVDEVMKDFDKFVGMESVKKALREIAYDMQASRRKMELGIGKGELIPVNIVLTGNPGTGKSSVAKSLGKLFKAVGVIPTDKVVVKYPKDIISRYINESDKMMDAAVNEAMGGVLFIDEAYDLCPDDSYGNTTAEGRKAVTVLMNRMLDDRGKLVIVCAGYKDRMEHFLDVNEGLRRRVTHYINIEDYTAGELTDIFMLMMKNEGISLDNDMIKEKIMRYFTRLVNFKDANFGNAGEAQKLLESAKRSIATRLQKIPMEDWTRELLLTITEQDIPL